MSDTSSRAASKKADGDDGQEQPNKRRRIALACSACRARKSRCDGARPKCGLCRDLGFECTYVQAASSTNVIVGKEYFSSLEDRVQHIEDTLDGFRTSINDLNLNITGRPVKPDVPRTAEPDNDHMMEPDTAVGDDQINEVFALGDGFRAMEQETGFFGPSSNIAFLRHIAKAVGKVKKAPNQLPTPASVESDNLDGGVLEIQRPGSPIRQVFHTQRIDVFTLPSNQETLGYIERYFDDPGFLYPFLHKPTFLATYHEMRKRDPREVPRTWLGLLNVVMTMATATKQPFDRNSSNSEERFKEAEKFFKRGMMLCQRPMMRGTSVEVVQFCLLASMYLQGSQKSIEAWTIHGLAVKAAFQLGLHSREASHKYTGMQRALRSRAWFGCVLVDRTLSMTFGRPAAIPDDYIRVDLPEPWPEYEPPSANRTVKDSTIFMNMTIQLYRYMWQAIDELYQKNLGSDMPLPLQQTVASMLRIDNDMSTWEEALPSHLRLRSSQTIALDMHKPPMHHVATSDERLSFLLTLRYHNVRLLIHRPLLAKFLDVCAISGGDATEIAILNQHGAASLHVNIRSAAEIIESIHAAAHSASKRPTLGAWWFSLYYTFNAALVLFASLVVVRPENLDAPPVTEETITLAKESLGKALEIMAVLDKGNVMVDRCAQYLGPLVAFINQIFQIPVPVSADLFQSAIPYGGVSGDPSYTTLPNDPTQFSMDFGEFMMPSDMDWMSCYFNPNNQQIPGPEFPSTWPSSGPGVGTSMG
ncbi:hypothetical protein EJ05DRAFT_503342 [Pseudovirgaria hyperparasitica]|uniref:Zn(2)-C6 fungal-type domain-containing protein n=1 Tax=Pseudovirgaria hyperparasitica TaxID=470096 RepID=A0A6A6W1V9_9PEZI|nr:uncharacterized protein EJ05DRAFT_503342 [Pseudovirgaria hyperparasitica]KAF2755031.1 hypothetical protein EJ05DRAFT_503342 [Pseudovirgaria hyperparasitica]